jgi:hypothetical protein
VPECVLCQIVARTLRAKILYEDGLVLGLDLPKKRTSIVSDSRS